MPQPSLGFIPSGAFLLVGVAHPSRGRLLPCSHPPGVNSAGARARPSHRGFHRRPCTVECTLAGSPPQLRAPFPPCGRVAASSRLPRDPGPRAPSSARDVTVFTCFEALFPPRSRTAPATEATRRGRCSPGLSPLQSLAPIEPRTLRPHGPFRPSQASPAMTRGATPRHQVRPPRPRGRFDLVGAPDRRATAVRTRATSR